VQRDPASAIVGQAVVDRVVDYRRMIGAEEVDSFAAIVPFIPVLAVRVAKRGLPRRSVPGKGQSTAGMKWQGAAPARNRGSIRATQRSR